MNQTSFSYYVNQFHGRKPPESGFLAGYAALIMEYDLSVPIPDIFALIGSKHKPSRSDEWIVLSPRHKPEDSLAGHLVFALKYEGINLGVLKKLFEKIETKDILHSITREPTGQYSRKVWFLYEWLMGRALDLPDLSVGNYVDLVDENLQFVCGKFENSKRHRIRNNLPGVKNFCPMIRKTPLLQQYIQLDLSQKTKNVTGKIHPDVMARTAAFLLIKDSKASYAIEGERPPQNRAQRWGRAIGQAGLTPVSKDELERLQKIVIDNPRFTKMGFRDQEGFIGEHDRRYGTPIPDHISARWKDLPVLMEGFIATGQKLETDSSFDAVLAAAIVAFGFVFIHPFVDGNGRIHRYLIHHMLLRKHYVEKGLIFPVSSIMLEKIDEYRQVLQQFSSRRIDLIEWKPSPDNNVEVFNETMDLYRYFDATKQAEFLYHCVQQTVEQTIPQEVAYLENYDLMTDYLDNRYQMPDKVIALLVRFLEQGKGVLSDRAKEKEFKELTAEEIAAIERKYQDIFMRLP